MCTKLERHAEIFFGVFLLFPHSSHLRKKEICYCLLLFLVLQRWRKVSQSEVSGGRYEVNKLYTLFMSQRMALSLWLTTEWALGGSWVQVESLPNVLPDFLRYLREREKIDSTGAKLLVNYTLPNPEPHPLEAMSSLPVLSSWGMQLGRQMWNTNQCLI